MIGGAGAVGVELLGWADYQPVFPNYTMLALGIAGVCAATCFVLYARRLRRVGLDERGMTFLYASKSYLLEWSSAEPPQPHVEEGKFGPLTLWRMKYPGADGRLRYHDGVHLNVLEAILSHPSCPWPALLVTLRTQGLSHRQGA